MAKDYKAMISKIGIGFRNASELFPEGNDLIY